MRPSAAPSAPAALSTPRASFARAQATDELRLVVRDNGTGFDVARMQRDPQRGIGLRNLRERMAALGGQFDIVSLPSGTRLTAALPLKTPSSEPSQS